MTGTAFVVHSDQLQRESTALGDAADRCQAVENALAGGSLPANAFGTTTHGPLIGSLCASFRTTVVDRMRSAGGQTEQLSDGVRQAAVAYDGADNAAATGYGQINAALAGGSPW